MPRSLLITGFFLILSALASAQDDPPQYNLNSDGRAFLLNEARTASFFLLGELHGENEIPALLHALWPEMSRAGYAHVAAEVSPWAAGELQTGPAEKPFGLSLWSRADALFIRASGGDIWGCDIEEGQPDRLISSLLSKDPGNAALRQMAAVTKTGYRRKDAPQLLQLARQAADEDLLDTFRVEALRSDPNRKYEASVKRENIMKKNFARHLVASPDGDKILLRFGRNHLHRGYDARGVSTLGNFAAELATSKGLHTFNVAAFAAGGIEHLNGETFDADDRNDEPAFRYLAALAKYPATVFDLRPLRPVLHRIPPSSRTALQTNLIYWAESYDAIICYQTVTPQ
ncbi:MAG TPA: hypothetical protein VFT60_05775 [Bryobacteraceae bacterium]|nr:hypothetical protein [Bryobacteraceae bacterium]